MCGKDGEKVTVEDLIIDRVYRYASQDNVEDEAILYAIRNRKDGSKGVLVNGYGISDMCLSKRHFFHFFTTRVKCYFYGLLAFLVNRLVSKSMNLPIDTYRQTHKKRKYRMILSLIFEVEDKNYRLSSTLSSFQFVYLCRNLKLFRFRLFNLFYEYIRLVRTVFQLI